MTRLLHEATYKELRKKTFSQQQKIVSRSKNVISHYMGLFGNRQLLFKTTSETRRSHFWDQKVWLNIPYTIKGNTWDALYKAMAKDVRLFCNCPSFRWWGYQYYLSSIDSVFGRKNKHYPGVRNPKLKGALCKHLYKVLGVLPANLPLIVRDIKQRHRKGVV